MSPRSTQHSPAPSAPGAASLQDHVFNDDLLMNNADLAFARSQFPQIVHVLDCARLREKFAEYDGVANEARDWVRRLGLATVISATLALVVVATKPIWRDGSWTRWFALPIELGGLLAALVAAGGLWLGPWRRRWLESRLMTERLRQWHFQLLVRRGKEIEASCHGSRALAAFENQRELWLADFLKAYEGRLDTHLESMTADPQDVDAWVHDSATTFERHDDVLPHVFQAYERLRLDHQYNFAVWKLRKSNDRPIWQFVKWPAICQVAVLSSLSSVCFIAALISSAILAYDDAFGIPWNTELYVRTGAISAALIGGALRTIQEGFAPAKELERYQDYRGRTAQLRDRFKRTTDARERLHLMEELELASVNEMKGFLRTHVAASFLLT